MQLPHLPFNGLDSIQLRQWIDAAIKERSGATDFRKAFSESDWKIAEMLWPHLDGLAELFDINLRDEGYYVAPRWQVDSMGDYIAVQSYSGDRYDEGMTVTGNFGSRDERLEVANGVAKCLNDRMLERWQMAVAQARLHQAEKEVVRLRALLAATQQKN